jgi:hypothetical protein
MITLADIVHPDTTHIRDAAIVLDEGLGKPGYVQSYTPTRSAIEIFRHLAQAVLPDATKEKRAMNWHGPYGSGKSHLGVVIGRLLRDGASSAEFSDLLKKLNNLGETQLAHKLRSTFLDPQTDPDAKPYLLISLNTSGGQPIPHQLVEALYRTLQAEPKLRDKQILSKTEYDAAYERFQEIVKSSPKYANTELSEWNLTQDYLTTAEMASDLKHHDPTAYKVFLAWHEAVCHGATFNPANYGGKKFIDAYLEAGKNLVEHGYSGIAVIWDEFGHALEELLSNPQRSAITEVKELQDFVENACKPDQGHTLFIGLTHVSLAEYGTRSNASEDISNRLKTIEGRFTPMRVELKPSEAEGYHLLGAQLRWTSTGQEYLQRSQPALQSIKSVCGRLGLFKHLSDELGSIIQDCYPLHPTTAAALFAISMLPHYGQAARTAFTFFRDLQKIGVFDHPVSLEQGLFHEELVRLPELLDYYKDSLERHSESDVYIYRRALAEVRAKGEVLQKRDEILAVLLLSKLLGDNFQTTEAFLAAALYDASADDPACFDLHQHLSWLKSTGLIWKNDVTEVWTLAGEAGVEAESLIDKKVEEYVTKKQSVKELLDSPGSADMKADLFPHLGDHDLEPSPCGIVRSYTVKLLSPPIANPRTVTALDSAYVAALYLVLIPDEASAQELKTSINGLVRQAVYFWVPNQGFGQTGLLDKLRRYLAIQALMNEESSGEGLKRQLQAKWERNRQELVDILGDLFGRKGLEDGKSMIFRAGDPTPLSCKSWHQFRVDLARTVQSEYQKEIHVRNMNLNKVSDEDYLGRKILTDIIQKILDYADNPAYQDDLLGEKETSESAAIIDGVLGANELFIRRAGGWDIKRIEETDGALREVLELIHGEFLKRRTDTFKTINLRKLLLSPPYGLPPVSHALFAAVALRHEQKRIAWQGSTRSKQPFAVNLANAFVKDSNYEIRLEDFTTHQKWMLTLLGLNLPESFRTYEPKQAASNLYGFIKALPAAVKTSNRLSEPARKLLEELTQENKTAHQLADLLLAITPARVEFPKAKHSDECKLTELFLVELFESFSIAKNANYHEVKTFLDGQLATVDRPILLANLEQATSPVEGALYRLLQASKIDSHGLNSLAGAAIQRTLDECDDKALGQLLERLRVTVVDNKDSKDEEKRGAIRAIIDEALATVPDNEVLLANLEAEPGVKIPAFAALLRKDWRGCHENIDCFVEQCSGKAIQKCNPFDIGELVSQIKRWIESHKDQKPKPEDLHRPRLLKYLTKIRQDFDCERLLPNLADPYEDSSAIAALAAAIHDPAEGNIDGLVSAWLQRPIGLCAAEDISQIEYRIRNTLERQRQALDHLEYLGKTLRHCVDEIPDKSILLQNLRSDGSPIALALAALVEANEATESEALQKIVQESLKKTIQSCRRSDIDALIHHANELLQKHKLDRDPRRQVLDDFRSIIHKHRDFLDQTKLMEIFRLVLQEIQVNRL